MTTTETPGSSSICRMSHQCDQVASANDPEIEEVVLRLYRDLARTDADWVPDAVAQADSPVVIGSDADEWWQGYDVIFKGWKDSRTSHGGTTLTPMQLSSWRVGKMAVAIDEPKFFVTSSEASGALRLTMVFVSSSDRVWRLLHLHASAPVSNDTLLSSSSD